MKLKITFGSKKAILLNNGFSAKISIFDSNLPLDLADALDSNPGIEVTEVCRIDGNTCIFLSHNLSPLDLGNIVGETISMVYNTSISYPHN